MKGHASETDDKARRLAFSNWSGWGALPEVFDPRVAQPWVSAARDWLSQNLTEAELRAARRSILNAHYTSPDIAHRMWTLAETLGWNGGRVLEPGCGIGIFMATAPAHADVIGIELDPITAALAAELHPTAAVDQSSIEALNPTRVGATLAIGNVPFADVAPTDPVLNPGRVLTLHNYAIAKSLASAQPGSPVILLTSSYTLDAKNPSARVQLARYGDFLGSVRLPDLAFKAQSGTSVTTDIVVFRRRPQVLSIEEAIEETRGQDWINTHTLAVTGPDGNDVDLSVNSVYRATTQDNIVGTIEAGGMYRRNTVRVTIDPDHYQAALDHSFQAINDKLRQPATNRMASSARTTVTPPTADRGEVAKTDRSDDSERPLDPTDSEPSNLTKIRVETLVLDPASAPPGNGSRLPEEPPQPQPSTETPPPWIKPGGLYGSRSTGFKQLDPSGNPVDYQPAPKKDAAALEAFIELRDAFMTLIEAEQQPGATDESLTSLRAALNRSYDAAVETLGHPLNHYTESTTASGTTVRRYPAIGGARKHDPDYFAVQALEIHDSETGAATKAAIFTSRQLRTPNRVDSCANVEDAIVVSLGETGAINPTRIAELLDTTVDDIDAELAGHAFLDHNAADADEWVLAATYLSGNVRAARRAAAIVAADDPRFERNVVALAAATPTDIAPEDISVQLGAPWLTPDEVKKFLQETLNNPLRGCEISFHPAVGWQMNYPSYIEHGEAMTGTYGTESMPALRIASTALAGRPIRVMNEVPTEHGTKKVLDRAATIDANSKLDELNAALAEWILDDPIRASDLADRYNTLFRSHAPPAYEPVWPRPPGLADNIELREHQNVALVRGLQSNNIGLFHTVGAGKTITMAAIAMELRRLGLAKKPLLVVPNHLVEQITADFHRAFPGAKVLLPSDRSNRGRAKLVASVAAGDWDAVVFSYEMFKAIPVSTEAEIDYLNSRADELREAITATSANGNSKSAKKIEKSVASLEERLKDLQEKPRDPTLTFEALGVDALLADEAHYAKNLVLADNTTSTVAPSPSQRALDLDLKLQLLRRTSVRPTHIVLATGTPISNSFAELWVMMRYLQPDVLAAAGVGRFDQFVAQFGKTVTEFEMHPTGAYKLTSRLAEFHNVPELQLLFRQTADVRLPDDLDLDRPDLEHGQRQAIVVPKNPQLTSFVESLARRAQMLDASRKDEDNMLNIYNDGRAAALSLQLVGLPEPTPSKLDLAAQRIFRTWAETRDTTYLDPATGEPHPVRGSLQIVFMDQGVPGSKADHGINLYEQLRDQLVERGLPKDQIVFIHEARDNETLFGHCRDGRYAVLVGSTAKMGTGMNVQTRARSLIHMDPTWRPADMEQREGRIVRQGNQNPTVAIYNMVAEGSTDALMYQGLERKARMIAQVLSGTNAARTVADVDSSLIQFGDMKALAAGNPLVVEQLELKRQVGALEIKQRSWATRDARLTKGIPQWRTLIGQLEPQLAAWQKFNAALPALDIRSWPIECFGRRSENWSEADQALRANLHRVPPLKTFGHDGDRSGSPMVIGRLGEWPINAQRIWDGLAISIQAGDTGLEFDLRLGQDDLEADSSSRLWQRIVNVPARQADDQAILTEDRLRRARSDLDQAERYAGKPFPQQNELDQARGQLAEVEEQLMPTQASPEVEPIDRQAPEVGL